VSVQYITYFTGKTFRCKGYKRHPPKPDREQCVKGINKSGLGKGAKGTESNERAWRQHAAGVLQPTSTTPCGLLVETSRAAR